MFFCLNQPANIHLFKELDNIDTIAFYSFVTTLFYSICISNNLLGDSFAGIY